MASIPLAALAVRPPEQVDTLGQYGKLVALKGMLQNQQFEQQNRPLQLQAAQQGLQEQQLATQQKQQSIDDQHATTQAMLNWDGKNPTELQKMVLDNHGSGTAALALSKHFLDIRNETATAVKNEGEGALAKANAQKTQYEQIAGQINSFANLPDEQLPQALLSTAQNLDPQHAQGLQAAAQLSPAQIRRTLPAIANGFLGYSAQIEAGLKDSETVKANAETEKTNIETAALKQFGGMTPGMQESKYLALEGQKNQGKPIAPADQAFIKAYERNKTLGAQFAFNLQNAGATGQGQGGQPSPVAQALADGSLKWNDFVSPRTPMSVKTQVLAEVKKINPAFNSGDFAVEQKAKEAFTSGAYSQQLNAINTARNHMQTFSSLADALNNNDVQALNKIGNAVGVQFGNDKATNFKIAAQAFGGEVGKAFDGAGVTQSERESASQAFNPNMSPAQLKGAVKTVDALLQGKQNALKQTYSQSQQAKPNFGEQGGGSKEIHYKIENGVLVPQ